MPGEWIDSYVPARLDRMPWSRWHWLIVFALGATWILDGLEVTLAGSLGGILTHRETLGLTDAQVGATATFYLVGAVMGALLFGYGTDRLGRKKLFFITVAVYLTATALTAFSWSFASYAFFRALTGAGIGGEYAAINSAIDELIPARVRGRVDLMINGSYWVGAAIGSVAGLLFLNTDIFAKDMGWRIAFGCGAALGLSIVVVRRNVPESPRWLFIHGREEEAEKIVDSIERAVQEETGQELQPPGETITIHQRERIPFSEIARVAFTKYRKRALLCLALFLGQAFLYNAITFDLGTILTTYFGVASGTVPLFLVMFAAGN